MIDRIHLSGILTDEWAESLDAGRTDLRSLDRPAIVYRAVPPSKYVRLHFVGVASLGHSKVQAMVHDLFGSTPTPKISRIDLCVDFPGLTVEFFRDRMTVEGTKTVGFIRSPRATTLRYGSPSSRSHYVVYPRNWKVPKNEAGPPLTRIERRFRGKACPVRSVERLELLRSFDPFKKVRLEPGPTICRGG